MPSVELREIVTEDDVEAVMGLRRGPGQERYLGSMISHFEDAIADASACPRKWSVHDRETGELVGFAMISDDIPRDVLDADDRIVGPYFLWRLLIDHRFQGRGYGRATVDAVADYVRGRAERRGPVHEQTSTATARPAVLPASASSGPVGSPTTRTSSARPARDPVRTRRTGAEPERPADHPPRPWRPPEHLAGLAGPRERPDRIARHPGSARRRSDRRPRPDRAGPPGRSRDGRRRPARPGPRLGSEQAA